MPRPRPPTPPRGSKSRETLAKTAERKIGDVTIFAFGAAWEMLVAVDLLSRLRVAEATVDGVEEVPDPDGWVPEDREERERVEATYFADMRAALLPAAEMARALPPDLIRKQRAVWEEEVARTALALWEPLNERGWSRALYRRAKAIYVEETAKGAKKEAIYLTIAERLFLQPEDKKLSVEGKIRRARRILRENKKARGGVFDIDKRLFARRPRSFQSITGDPVMDEPNDAYVSDEEYGPKPPPDKKRSRSVRTKKPPKPSGRI